MFCDRCGRRIERAGACPACDAAAPPRRPGRLCLGRDPENEMIVDVPGVSRRHAEIAASTPGAYRIRDLGTANGTFVDGRRVAEAPLGRGARVSLGRTPLDPARLAVALDVLDRSLADGERGMLRPRAATGSRGVGERDRKSNRWAVPLLAGLALAVAATVLLVARPGCPGRARGPAAVSARIVAVEGGVVALGDEVRVTLPPGALAADGNVSIRRVDDAAAPPLAAGMRGLSPTYDITAGGGAFHVPLEIDIRAAFGDAHGGGVLGLRHEGSGNWLPARLVALEGDRVRLSTFHLSQVKIVAQSCPAAGDSFPERSLKAVYLGWAMSRTPPPGLVDALARHGFNYVLAFGGRLHPPSGARAAPFFEWEEGTADGSGPEAIRDALLAPGRRWRVEAWINAGGDAEGTVLADYLYGQGVDSARRWDALASALEPVVTRVRRAGLAGVHLNFEVQRWHCLGADPAIDEGRCMRDFPRDFAALAGALHREFPGTAVTVSTLWEWNELLPAFREAGAELAIAQAYNLGNAGESVDLRYRSLLIAGGQLFAQSPLDRFVLVALPAYGGGAAHPAVEAENLEVGARGLACAPVASGSIAGAAVYDVEAFEGGRLLGAGGYEITDALLAAFDRLIPGSPAVEPASRPPARTIRRERFRYVGDVLYGPQQVDAYRCDLMPDEPGEELLFTTMDDFLVVMSADGRTELYRDFGCHASGLATIVDVEFEPDGGPVVHLFLDHGRFGFNTATCRPRGRSLDCTSSSPREPLE